LVLESGPAAKSAAEKKIEAGQHGSISGLGSAEDDNDEQNRTLSVVRIVDTESGKTRYKLRAKNPVDDERVKRLDLVSTVATSKIAAREARYGGDSGKSKSSRKSGRQEGDGMSIEQFTASMDTLGIGGLLADPNAKKKKDDGEAAEDKPKRFSTSEELTAEHRLIHTAASVIPEADHEVLSCCHIDGTLFATCSNTHQIIIWDNFQICKRIYFHASDKITPSELLWIPERECFYFTDHLNGRVFRWKATLKWLKNRETRLDLGPSKKLSAGNSKKLISEEESVK
jgi:hypothetical protein